jgi:hypothetical protein
MRSVVAVLVASAMLGACSPPQLDEFARSGRIRGRLLVGDHALESGWVEMIELTGRPSERCGPGDCGLDADLLRRGAYWNPGRWRVTPPAREGWRSPDPFVIIVRAKELTTFEVRYEQL